MSAQTRHTSRGLTLSNTRVCLIQDYLTPFRIPLFERLSRDRGIDFTLLLMAKQRPNYQQWADLWSNSPFRCVIVPGFRFYLKSSDESRFNPSLFRTLVEHRPDVVICSGFSSNSLVAFAYKVLFCKRVIIWTEATARTESFLSYPVLRTWIRRRMANRTDAFIDAGTASRDYARSLVTRSRPIPFFRSFNCIDTNAFSRQCELLRSDTKAHHAFKERFGPRVILFSGQLIERKNIRQLINVYEEILRRSGAPISLVILGQGPLQDYLLSQKAERNLSWLFLEGFQKESEYFKYFAIADVFLLLSVFDCNPLVVFEALSASLPVVCSAHAGNAIDFIKDGENGYIVDPEDTADTATKTLAILDTSDQGPMRVAAWEAVQKANYDDAAQGFIEAVETVSRR